MITLHNEKETNFRRNGYGVLDDLFNAALQGSWELNGEFKISFEVPFFADVEKTRHLVNGNILQVPVPHMERQLFRIYRSEKSLGYVQGEARHIFYDLLDNFIEDTNIQNQPGNNAIQQILNNTVYEHRFTGSSNINDRNANARVVRMNPVEAILDDGRSNSFVSRWSGELARNNFDIEMLQQRGSDNGVTIRHRENLMGYHATIDRSTVVTRIRPVGFDGLTLPELYVDSPLMDEEHPIIKEYEFRDVKAAIGEYAEDEDAIPLEDAYEELRRLAEEEFSVHHVDEPESTIDVDFIQLKNMVGYEDLQEIQEVKAGDTVTVTVPDEHFDVTSRLVAFEWNPLIEDEYTNTTLGNHVREFTSSNQSQGFQRDLEEVQEQVVQAMQAANGRNTNWRGDANPNDLDLDDWDGLRLGDYYTQSNGEHYIVYQFVEVAGERYFTELINTAHTDEASRRVEEAISEAQDAKAQVERESEERRADIQAESERLSTEWNERIEANEQIVEGVRHSTEELMNDFDRALSQANFTSIEDLTTTLNSRSLEAIENAERADGFAIEALDVANGFGTRITDVESTVDGQVTSINTAVETAERVERTISEVTTDVDGLSSRFVSMEADIEGITNTVSDYEGRISRTEQRADGLYDVVHDPNEGLLTEVTRIAEGFDVLSERSVQNIFLNGHASNLDSWRTSSTSETLTTQTSQDSRFDRMYRLETSTSANNRGAIFDGQSWRRELVEGRTYTVSLWMNGGGSTRTVYIGIDGSRIANAKEFSVPDGWRQYSMTFRYTGNNPALRIYGPNLSPLLFTGIEMETSASSGNLGVLSDQLSGKVSEGDVYSQLLIDARNVLFDANDRIILSAPNVTFTGSAFIPNAAIEEVSANKIIGNDGQFNTLRSRFLTSNVIESDHLNVTTAMIDRFFANSALIERLTSQQAFIDQLSASNLEIDGGRVHGTLNGNSLDFVNIDVNSLSGNLSEFVRTQWNNATNGHVLVDGNGINMSNQGSTMRLADAQVEFNRVDHFNNEYNGMLTPERIYFSTDTGRWVQIGHEGVIFRENGRTARLRFNGDNYVFDTNVGMYRNHINSVDWIRIIGQEGDTMDTAIFNSPNHPGSIISDTRQITIGLGSRESVSRIASFSGNISFFRNVFLGGNNVNGVTRLSLNDSTTELLTASDNASGVLRSGQRLILGIRTGSGIANTSSRIIITGRIDMQRNVWMNGNTMYGQVGNESDRRLKMGVEETEQDSLSIIRKLDFVEYEWIDKEKYGSGKQFGLIAQDIDQSLVLYDEESDIYSINSSRLPLVNAHAIQQLFDQHENTLKVASHAYLLAEQHEDELACYKKKIEELEKKVKRLEGAA